MVKTNGMLPGADYFLSHVSLIFDHRKSQPLIAGAVQRIRDRWQGGEVGRIKWNASTSPAIRRQRDDLVARLAIVLDAERGRLHCSGGDKAMNPARESVADDRVQSNLLPPSSFVTPVSSLTSVSSRSVRNVNTATVTATS